MPVGHHSGRGGPTYRGYPRLRMERKPSGSGTVAVCAVPCGDCGATLERTTFAIRQAESEGRSMCCNKCRGKRSSPQWDNHR